jgi:hypothetical protein
VEELPKTKIIYRMLKDLLERVECLEQDNKKMREQVLREQRKDILFYLNENITTKHSIPDTIKQGFIEWYRKFNIVYKHLDIVFHGTLNDAIKQIIIENIEKKNEIPICAFTEKRNTLYIYDKVEKKEPVLSTVTDKTPVMFKGGAGCGGMTSWSWRIMKNGELSLMIEFIQKVLLQRFILWEDANANILELNEEMKENDIKYSMKIDGNEITMENRTDLIKKWLYEKVAK